MTDTFCDDLPYSGPCLPPPILCGRGLWYWCPISCIGPPALESPESLRESLPGPLTPPSKKCPKKSLRNLGRVFLRLRRLFRGCFEYKRHSRRLFGNSVRTQDSCRGQAGWQCVFICVRSLCVFQTRAESAHRNQHDLSCVANTS